MKEIYGDLFKFANSKEYTHCMITTNGTIKANGLAVMGRGCAYEMAQRFTGTSKTLANNIIKFGNVPSFLLINNDVEYWSFPVKHNWWEQADIELIKKSIELFKKDLRFNSKVLLPRPGCGNGGLNWIDVKQIIEPLLDERFYIVHFAKD